MCDFTMSIGEKRKCHSQYAVTSDGEFDEEEEEEIVLVELNGLIDPNILNQQSVDKLKIIGIESDQPILQLDKFVFAGEYEETVGTALMFEEDDEKLSYVASSFSQKSDNINRLKCYHKTFKTLKMKRIFVSKNDKIVSEQCDAKSSESEFVENEGLPKK